MWLTGVGTSWHAALAGELLLAQVGRLGARVRAINAFELLHYGPAAASGEGCVVISHRGQSPSGPAAVTRARAAGGVTVAITGKGGDGLAAAEHVLRTVEQEASGCHTVSYTTAVAMLASLAAAIGHDDELGHSSTRFRISSPSCSVRRRGRAWPNGSAGAGATGSSAAVPTSPPPTRPR